MNVLRTNSKYRAIVEEAGSSDYFLPTSEAHCEQLQRGSDTALRQTTFRHFTTLSVLLSNISFAMISNYMGSGRYIYFLKERQSWVNNNCRMVRYEILNEITYFAPALQRPCIRFATRVTRLNYQEQSLT